MSQVRSKDTSIELVVRGALHKLGYRFRKHKSHLPGRPDIVFCRANVVVFIDGDFWHGYRFHKWSASLPLFWRNKIGTNVERDMKNVRDLRSRGFHVIRLWQHEIENDLEACLVKVVNAVECYK